MSSYCYHCSVVLNCFCSEPLSIDAIVHLVIREEFFEFSVSSLTQTQQLLTRKRIRTHAPYSEAFQCIFIQGTAVEAEVDSQLDINPLASLTPTLVANSIENILELLLEKFSRLLLAHQIQVLHYN